MRDDRDITVIESNGGSGVKWFLLGAAIGAGLGILFAPQAGKRTRRDLAVRTRKLRDSAEDVVEEITSEVQSRGRRIKETVAEFADEVMEEVRDGKREVEEAGATGRDAMEQRLAQARSRARARAAVPVGGDDAEDDDESA